MNGERKNIYDIIISTYVFVLEFKISNESCAVAQNVVNIIRRQTWGGRQDLMRFRFVIFKHRISCIPRRVMCSVNGDSITSRRTARKEL